MIEINRTKKEELLDWLDAQIEFKEKTCKFDEVIYNLYNICNEKTIHVSNVRAIANIIGYDIHTGEHDENYYREYFMYKGYEVFRLEHYKEEEDDAE